MLGVDTNVLIRYLIRDDQPQYERARRLVDREVRKGEPLLVSLLVLLESEWVLRSRYELPKSEIVAAFSALLDTADLAFEDEPSIEHCNIFVERLIRGLCRLPDRRAQPPTGLPCNGKI